MTRDKTRTPGKQPLSSDTVQRVVDLALGPPPGEEAVLAEARSDSWCLVERSGLVSDVIRRRSFSPRHRDSIQEGLHRGFAEARRP